MEGRKEGRKEGKEGRKVRKEGLPLPGGNDARPATTNHVAPKQREKSLQ
jgi:hypothetical protein